MQPLSGFAGKLHAASFLPLFLDYLLAVPYASPLLCRPPAAEEEMGYLGRSASALLPFSARKPGESDWRSKSETGAQS